MDWSQFFNLPQGGLLSSQAFAPLAMYRAFRSGMPFNMPRPSPIPQYLPPPLPNWHYAPPPPAPARGGILDILSTDWHHAPPTPAPAGGGILNALSTGDFSAVSNG